MKKKGLLQKRLREKERQQMYGEMKQRKAKKKKYYERKGFIVEDIKRKREARQ